MLLLSNYLILKPAEARIYVVPSDLARTVDLSNHGNQNVGGIRAKKSPPTFCPEFCREWVVTFVTDPRSSFGPQQR